MASRRLTAIRNTVCSAAWLFAAAGSLMLGQRAVLAQDLLIQQPGSEALEEGEGKQHMIDTLGKWSSLYKGYDKSPILIDRLDDSSPHSSRYPKLAGSNYRGDDQQKNTLMTMVESSNLSVQDEVTKTSMAVYQPLIKIQSDFADDKNQRDAHLNLFTTVRGIALLTLSYLDKTIAAGLATTQEQVDQHTTHYLLKQIAWAQSKMANPERAWVYKDTDEKVESCLSQLKEKKLLMAIGSEKHINFDFGVCDDRCLSSVTKAAGGRVVLDSTKAGQLDYCVCCSEVTSKVDIANEGDPADIIPVPKFSLVKRAICGQKGPCGSPAALSSPPSGKVKDFFDQFRDLYGDVIYNSPGIGDLRETQAISLTMPNFTVTDRVRFFRNGCGAPDLQADMTSCPAAPKVDLGICPAIKAILCAWPAKDTKTWKELWREASLGKIFTAEDFVKMFKLIGEAPGTLPYLESSSATSLANSPCDSINKTVNNSPDTGISILIPKLADLRNWKPGGYFGQYLDNLCDSAAIGAFKRYHYRMMAVAEDHLLLNRKATEADKKYTRDLMGRVTTDLELAERDMQGNMTAERNVEGELIQADRTTVEQMNEFGRSLQNMDTNNKQMGSTANNMTGSGAPTSSGTTP